MSIEKIFDSTPPENKKAKRAKVPVVSKPQAGRNALLSRALQGIGERELSMLRTVDELKFVSLTAISRMYFNSAFTARDHVQQWTDLELLQRVQVDSFLVRQSVGYETAITNPIITIGRVGRSVLSHYLAQRGVHSQTSVLAPTLSWSHDVGVSEALSYMVSVARATHEIPVDPGQYRASVRLYGERHSGVWKDVDFTWAKRAGRHVPSTTKVASQAVVRPDASLRWHIRPATIDSPYAVRPGIDLDARWTPTRHSWQGAISHESLNIKNMAEAEQYGEGCYRWWLLEMETGNNGAAIMQDKILRYQRLRAEMKRKLIFGWACPQVIIVVRNNSQIPRQIELWRKHCNVAMPGAVLVTSLEGLYKSFQAGRAALLNLKCLVDPLTSREPRYLTYPEALALSVAISD